MAFTLAQQVTKAAATTTAVAFTTSALTAGNLVVICLEQHAASSAVTISSVTVNSGAATFTFDSTVAVTAGPPPEDWQAGVNSYIQIMYCLSVTTGGATTVTVNLGASKAAGGVLTEWNPNGDTVSVDGSNNGGGGTASTNMPAPAITTTGPGLIVSAINTAAGTSTPAVAQESPGSGWTAPTSLADTWAGVLWQVFTGAQTGAHGGWTNGTSQKFGACTIGFKTTASGGGGGAVVPELMLLGVGN